MGFSGGIGSPGFNNAIGGAGIDIPAYKGQSTRSNVPRAKDLSMWFMAVPNERARVCDVDNAGGINRLRDFSGNRNNLVQATAASRPTVKQSTTAGKASFVFTTAQWLGGDDDAAFDTGTGAFDIYIVFNLTAGSGNQGILGTKASVSAGQAGISLMCTAAEKLRGVGSSGSAQKATALTANNYDDKGFFVARLSRTGTTTGISTSCTDGTIEAKSVADGGINYNGGVFAIGAFNAGGAGIAGNIVEVMAYKGVRLNGPDNGKVMHYINTKYNLALSI